MIITTLYRPNGNTDPQTPHWVAIDKTEGTLTVLIQEEAPLDVTDDDVPVRYNLTYTITAFDGVHTVTLDVRVFALSVLISKEKFVVDYNRHVR